VPTTMILPEPGVCAVLDGAQRGAIERIAGRLPELVPPMRPVLTHGDLAPGNILATPDGRAALIDPAASYGWPEVDISMIYCLRGQVVPDRYFAAYEEVSPLQPGWRERNYRDRNYGYERGRFGGCRTPMIERSDGSVRRVRRCN